MWTSKIGLTAKPLILALSDANGLVDVSALAGPGNVGLPQLRMRLRNSGVATTVSRDVTPYTDPNGIYNAQVVFADFTGIVPGVYLSEVDAYANGEEITFPCFGYVLLKFLSGVN